MDRSRVLYYVKLEKHLARIRAAVDAFPQSAVIFNDPNDGLIVYGYDPNDDITTLIQGRPGEAEYTSANRGPVHIQQVPGMDIQGLDLILEEMASGNKGADVQFLSHGHTYRFSTRGGALHSDNVRPI